MGIPLSVHMEETQTKLHKAVKKIKEESKLPAFIIEKMLIEVLSDIQKEKASELVLDMKQMILSNSEDKDNGDKGKDIS